MSRRLRARFQDLHELSKGDDPNRRLMLAHGNTQLLNCICEITDNVLRGCVQLSCEDKQKLQRHKHAMRTIANKKYPKRLKKRLLSQKGGFLPILLAAALPLVANLLGEAISSAIKR